jgi:hypothetical protein
VALSHLHACVQPLRRRLVTPVLYTQHNNHKDKGPHGTRMIVFQYVHHVVCICAYLTVLLVRLWYRGLLWLTLKATPNTTIVHSTPANTHTPTPHHTIHPSVSHSTPPLA